MGIAPEQGRALEVRGRDLASVVEVGERAGDSSETRRRRDR